MVDMVSPSAVANSVTQISPCASRVSNRRRGTSPMALNKRAASSKRFEFASGTRRRRGGDSLVLEAGLFPSCTF